MLTSCCSGIDVSRSLLLLWLNYPPTSELTSGFHTTNTHSTAVFDSLLGVMQTRMTVMKPRPVYEDRLVGYQTMWRLLIRNHHLRTSHSTVRLLLCQMDPAGVEEWQHHRLRRRAYFSRGPNDTWHVDGYDKLWPYVILIKGMIINMLLTTTSFHLLVPMLSILQHFQWRMFPMFYGQCNMHSWSWGEQQVNICREIGLYFPHKRVVLGLSLLFLLRFAAFTL